VHELHGYRVYTAELCLACRTEHGVALKKGHRVYSGVYNMSYTAIGYTQIHGYRVYTVHSYTAIGYTQLHGYRVYTVHSYMAIGYTQLRFVSHAGQSMGWP
jgi:hypothetical protein